VTLHDDLRTIALHEFATAGYAATSLQRIADLAGTSKPSVLYHYSSKEQLLADAITPALDELTAVVDSMEAQGFGGAERRAFLEQFVDALLAHREVLHLIINQATTLQDVPAFARAQELMRHLADFFDVATSSTLEKLRFGVALAGAAYVLASADLLGLDQPPPDEVRSALVTVMTELLDPAPAGTTRKD
jgi:AcrR family transcriptional regulator